MLQVRYVTGGVSAAEHSTRVNETIENLIELGKPTIEIIDVVPCPVAIRCAIFISCIKYNV